MLPFGKPTLDGPFAIRKERKLVKSRDKLTRHSHGSGWDKQSCTLYPGETSYNLQSNQESVDLTSSVAPHSCDTSVAGDQTGCIGFGSSYVTERVDGWYGGVDELTQTENMEYTRGVPHLTSNYYEEARPSFPCNSATNYDLVNHDLGYPANNDLLHQPNSEIHVHSNMAQVNCRQSKPIKWHQLPPQSDPKLEEKRLRAIKSRNDRERQKQVRKDLESQLEALGEEVSNLRLQKKSREENITFFEREIRKAQCNGRSNAEGEQNVFGIRSLDKQRDFPRKTEL
ncbi:hypothetical protein Pmani_009412 [Petrolisthes manimaculis]|uniref:BZIP domain-containing protein n=1 Tax=Petrolisthes manimaculis TaxID=1843537 RepID=A0AAE1Q714_9EUCA|nr:hypothetical protein Pmani_009412 [Petrolisthes manimaculis]